MPSLIAALLVFASSAAVLVLEILAGRLLAPYVGVTLESFTGIIGVILAGIAAGSWAGGRLADRRDPRSLLGPTLVLGGIFALLSIPVVDYLGANMRGARADVVVILTLAGFFLPAAVLSAVTPTVIKIQLHDLDNTGAVVGRLSAISTVGGLVGTFATGFVLVAAWPTRPIIRAVGAVLLVAGFAVWLWLARHRRPGAGLMIGALVASAASFAAAHPCEYESAYFCAFVETDPDDPSGRVLWLDTLRHSYVDLDDPTHLDFSYSQTMSDVLAAIAPPGQPLDVAHIGGGGLSLPRYLRATRPGTRSTVLELDPLLTDIAVDELGYTPGPDIHIVTGDARVNITDIPDGSQDVVIGDAFGGVSVPWHLTTAEFLAQVRQVLRPGGVYALNLIDYPPLGFARAEAVTLAEVFDHVAVFAPPARLAGDDGGNFVVVASDEPLPVAAILQRNAERGDDEEVVTTGDGPSPDATPSFDTFVGDAEVLVDDHAPVDQLLNPYPDT
jgi:spermidine synthase